MFFLFWNIKYVYLPTFFEVVSFSWVSKYRILSSSFRVLKTTSCVEKRDWSSYIEWVSEWLQSSFIVVNISEHCSTDWVLNPILNTQGLLYYYGLLSTRKFLTVRISTDEFPWFVIFKTTPIDKENSDCLFIKDQICHTSFHGMALSFLVYW